MREVLARKQGRRPRLLLALRPAAAAADVVGVAAPREAEEPGATFDARALLCAPGRVIAARGTSLACAAAARGHRTAPVRARATMKRAVEETSDAAPTAAALYTPEPERAEGERDLVAALIGDHLLAFKDAAPR